MEPKLDNLQTSQPAPEHRFEPADKQPLASSGEDWLGYSPEIIDGLLDTCCADAWASF